MKTAECFVTVDVGYHVFDRNVDVLSNIDCDEPGIGPRLLGPIMQPIRQSEVFERNMV